MTSEVGTAAVGPYAIDVVITGLDYDMDMISVEDALLRMYGRNPSEYMC
jgi:hypothetical protein